MGKGTDNKQNFDFIIFGSKRTINKCLGWFFVGDDSLEMMKEEYRSEVEKPHKQLQLKI